MLTEQLYGIWKLADVPGWQKWFGAAVLGFVFALYKYSSFSLSQLLGFLIGVSLILSYNQAINDCFDVEIDKVKQARIGKKLIVSNVISQRLALSVTLSILVFGLVFSALASLNLLFVAAVMAFLGTIYSTPPLRLKMRYPFSTLTQLIGSFLPFLAGVAALSFPEWQAMVISSAFCFLAMIHRFMHEIYYSDIDAITGKMTVAVKKGVKTAKLLRKTFLVIGIAEFVVFTLLGWVSLGLLLTFFVYVLLCVENLWARRLSSPLNKAIAPILGISGLVLFPISLYMFLVSSV